MLLLAKVIGRKRDNDGNPVGMAHPNPIIDTRVYEVIFHDGHVEEYAANVIAENMYVQVDAEGNQFALLQEIIGHRKDNTALNVEDMYVQGSNNLSMKKSTKGWHLQIMWKDGSTTWEPLKDLKSSNPVEVAEYAVAHELIEEPAFKWWVPHVIKKRNRLVSAIKRQTSHRKKNYKFGIEIPHSVERGLAIDKETGTTFWVDAISKEMKNVRPAFNILEEGSQAPVGSKYIRCHMNFEVKMNFTRKARFVAGGHMTEPPAHLTYSSVVSRDSVRLAFLLAALNDLDLLAADIGNAYLNANTREKVHTVCSLEFGHQNLGKIAVITKALYGLKSSGAAWRSMFAASLQELGFTSSIADPDVWYRAAS
jgi:hypothetical protein